MQEIKRFGGSNVYSRLIAMKCRGTSSLLRDVYLGGDRPWGIEPAPDPDVPPEIVQAIGEHISQEVTQLVQAALPGRAGEPSAPVCRRCGACSGRSPRAASCFCGCGDTLSCSQALRRACIRARYLPVSLRLRALARGCHPRRRLRLSLIRALYEIVMTR